MKISIWVNNVIRNVQIGTVFIYARRLFSNIFCFNKTKFTLKRIVCSGYVISEVGWSNKSRFGTVMRRGAVPIMGSRALNAWHRLRGITKG